MTEDELRAIEARAEKAPEGPWRAGGPVTREAICKTLTADSGPNGLTREVWEIGHEEDRFPPGICIVNNYYNIANDTHASAEDAAIFIAEARSDVPALVAEVRRLNAELARYRNPVRQAQGAWSPVDGVYIE